MKNHGAGEKSMKRKEKREKRMKKIIENNK